MEEGIKEENRESERKRERERERMRGITFLSFSRDALTWGVRNLL